MQNGIRSDNLTSILKDESTLLPKHARYHDIAARHADVAFTSFKCADNVYRDIKHCSYLNAYFELGNKIPLSKVLCSKYLIDIDGNGYSGLSLPLPPDQFITVR